MGLAPDQRIISADDHMDIHVLPPDLWQERLPQAWRERGPRVEETSDGPFWIVDGQKLSPSGRKAAGYIRADAHGFRPGQPDTRIQDMDKDGIHTHVIYSPMTTQMRIADGELRAARHLREEGWHILGRNVRAGGVEIDLVATRAATLAFVEVKTRRSRGHGAPEEAVDARKQARLVRGAAAWLHGERRRFARVRFDVIVCEVDATGCWRLRHLENAFDASG